MASWARSVRSSPSRGPTVEIWMLRWGLSVIFNTNWTRIRVGGIDMKVRRIANWRVIALAACLVGTSSTLSLGVNEAGAAQSSSADGEAFAQSLLTGAPLPSGAVAASKVQAPLRVLPEAKGTTDIYKYFVLKSKIDLAAFIDANRPQGAVVSGPDSETSGQHSTTYEYSLPLANRHIAFESIDYTTGETTAGVEELRVDAEVDWVAVQPLVMPVTGVVTLTGYGKLSLANPSSKPSSVTLTTVQALALRRQIMSLTNAPTGAFCMENSTLFTITVAPSKGQSATWTAKGDECPAYLTVASAAGYVSLIDSTCPFRNFIRSLLPATGAKATRKELKNCSATTQL